MLTDQLNKFINGSDINNVNLVNEFLQTLDVCYRVDSCSITDNKSCFYFGVIIDYSKDGNESGNRVCLKVKQTEQTLYIKFESKIINNRVIKMENRWLWFKVTPAEEATWINDYLADIF